MLFGLELLGAAALIVTGGLMLWRTFRGKHARAEPQSIHIDVIGPKEGR